ncbi:putative transport protein [Escherichia coli]|uniref:Putative transport protein n=1 Tax=Escherichia coli TaxID=562 RepID=A0A377B1E4_ECOLX|nr:putative transport protein [Escherichia coli]
MIQQPLAVLATLAIILFGKSLAAFFLVRLFGHSQRTALTIAASLAQIGEFAFILAGLGMALNLLPQAGQNLVLAGAILSIMLNPVLFALLEKYLARPKRWKSRRWKRQSKKRSRSQWIFATMRYWWVTVV